MSVLMVWFRSNDSHDNNNNNTTTYYTQREGFVLSAVQYYVCAWSVERERERKGMLAMFVRRLCQCEEKHVFCVPVREEMVTHTYTFLPLPFPLRPTSIFAWLVWWLSLLLMLFFLLSFLFFETSWSVHPKGRKHVHLGQDFSSRGPEPQFLSIEQYDPCTHTHAQPLFFARLSFMYLCVLAAGSKGMCGHLPSSSFFVYRFSSSFLPDLVRSENANRRRRTTTITTTMCMPFK